MIKRTFKAIQKHFDDTLFNRYDNGDDVFKEYLLIEVNQRRRPDLGILFLLIDTV